MVSQYNNRMCEAEMLVELLILHPSEIEMTSTPNKYCWKKKNMQECYDKWKPCRQQHVTPSKAHKSTLSCKKHAEA